MTASSHPGRAAAGLVVALILSLPVPTASADDPPADGRVVTDHVQGETVTFLELDRPHGTVAFQIPPAGRDALPAWTGEFADRTLGPDGIAETVLREWVETERRGEEEYRARKKAAKSAEERAAAERWRFSYLDPAVRREADRIAKRAGEEGGPVLAGRLLKRVRIEVYADRELAKKVVGVTGETGPGAPVVRYLADRAAISGQSWRNLETQLWYSAPELVWFLCTAYLERCPDWAHPLAAAFRYHAAIRSFDPEFTFPVGDEVAVRNSGRGKDIGEALFRGPETPDPGDARQRLALALEYLRRRDETILPRLLAGLTGNLKGVSPVWSASNSLRLFETAAGGKAEAVLHEFPAWVKEAWERDRLANVERFRRLVDRLQEDVR